MHKTDEPGGGSRIGLFLAGLRLRLILLALLVLVPAYSLIFDSVVQSKHRAEEHALEEAQWLTQMMAAEQRTVFDVARSQLQMLARMTTLREPGWTRTCQQALAAVVALNPMYLNFAVIDVSGSLRCSALTIPHKVTFADRDYFREALEKKRSVVSDYQIGRLSGKGTVVMAEPVLTSAGDCEAIVVAALDVASLARRIVASAAQSPQVALPAGAITSIVNTAGGVIARFPDPDHLVGTTWPHAPLIETIVAHPESGTTREHSVDGVERLYAYAPFLIAPSKQFYLVVGIPTHAVFAASQRLFERAMITLALVMVGVLLAAWIGGDLMIMKPMAQLMRAVRRIAGGDLSARSGLGAGRNEFAQLARSFDEMAQTLEQRQISLTHAEARTANVIELSPDAIVSVDAESRIVLYNRAACSTFGYSREEVIGQPFETLMPDTSAQVSRERFLRGLAAPKDASWKVYRAEVLGRRKGGEVFPAEASVSRTSEDGRFAFTVFVRDISERRRAELQIREMNANLEERVRQRTAELQAANDELESFSYSVSHDLRAPLRAIDGFSQALVEDYGAGFDDQARDYLRRVRSATQRMGQLIDDLLALARVTRTGLQPERVDLSALANDVVAELAHARPEGGPVWHIAPDLTASGDPRLLRLVLLNLFDNACKYTALQPRPVVEFGAAEVRADQASFFVRDNGVGFDMAHAGKLFGAFQRLHGADEFPGTGIGLATVRRILHRHGGDIHAQASPGVGATFFFSLPL